MILKLIYWIYPIFLITFDLAFFDKFIIFPNFFFFESIWDFNFEKSLRYTLYLTIYSIVIFKELNIFAIIIITFILLLDSFKNSFLKTWILPLLESFAFFSVFLINNNWITIVSSIFIALLLNLYLTRKKILKYR